MMIQQTLTQLRTLKLDGFADGLEEQLTQPGAASLSFEERLSLLVDREANWRDDRRRTRLLKQARLKYPQAAIEDLDTRAGRGVDPRSLTSLVLGEWVEAGYSLLISGPTGAGKSWLACALAQYACRRGHSALYLRVPRLGEELRVLHGNGGFTKWLLQVARVDVLLLDDWGMAPLDAMVRNDLLEMIDDRSAGKATIITSQLLRGRARKICNALNNLMRSPLARAPLLSASSGFPSIHNDDVFVSRVGETGGHHVCKVFRISTEDR